MKLGIVGLPNVGKSTLFNAITSTKNAEAANYPFCTIEPNSGIVAVPDKRLDKLAEVWQTNKKTPAIVEFVDIAGLVKGASQGAGLGNKFLGHIRECDAIVHVVRCFDDDNIIHVVEDVSKAEAVDPIILNMKLVDVCQCRPCDCSLTEIPQAILDCFGDSLTQGGDVHRLYVTLGQFSIVRLERDTQLLVPVYDYCMPDKECACGDGCEDPCALFRNISFPVGEFFPPNTVEMPKDYASTRSYCACH